MSICEMQKSAQFQVTPLASVHDANDDVSKSSADVNAAVVARYIVCQALLHGRPASDMCYCCCVLPAIAAVWLILRLIASSSLSQRSMISILSMRSRCGFALLFLCKHLSKLTSSYARQTRTTETRTNLSYASHLGQLAYVIVLSRKRHYLSVSGEVV